jgi:hypothetical protein
VTGRTTSGWSCFDRLPPNTHALARRKYQLWRRNHSHPSLHFKQIVAGPLVGSNQRSASRVGRQRNNEVVWFWIGSHAEYDQLIDH